MKSGNLNFLEPLGHSRPVTGLLYLFIHTVGAELFDAGRRTDRQTDMTKLPVAFRNIANVPKNKDDICVFVCLCGWGGGDFRMTV
jgi:hypothetical protein